MPKSPTKSQSKAKPPPRPESLVRMEQRLKKTIPYWLWDACIPIAEDDNTDPDCIYSATTPSQNKRMAMKRIQDLVDARFHQKYPDRPEEKDTRVYSEPKSESMKALKELLDASPVAKGRLDDFTDAEKEYVYFHHDMFSGSQSWEEHVEKELMVARWAVRDRCADCVSGITGYEGVYNYQWSDESMKWLRDNPPIERNLRRKLVKVQ
ncbi:hypothetical protein ARMGADRAFT_1077717 [Armillaria gallica]|uniref:Uncharacterized protein n=1 Tax=Armillaria gallica TaxID=47427 RepID=A0A2H3DXQ4_ARMGA|nr:hypothetical protein ARMGADRAFT_1077717 [Armillaria gallica]